MLEDELNDGVEEEVQALLDDLADDQLAETLALAWVGRGTYDASEWDDAFAEASDLGTDERMDELLDMPLLARPPRMPASPPSTIAVTASARSTRRRKA